MSSSGESDSSAVAHEDCATCRRESSVSSDSIGSSCVFSDSDQEIESVDSYHVLVLGAPGVGKTSLTRQFMTSEYAIDDEIPPGKNSPTI